MLPINTENDVGLFRSSVFNEDQNMHISIFEVQVSKEKCEVCIFRLFLVDEQCKLLAEIRMSLRQDYLHNYVNW